MTKILSESCISPVVTVAYKFVCRMLQSPTKRMTPAQKVRFDNAASSVTPLKGVLKKPETVIPV